MPAPFLLHDNCQLDNLMYKKLGIHCLWIGVGRSQWWCDGACVWISDELGRQSVVHGHLHYLPWPFQFRIALVSQLEAWLVGERNHLKKPIVDHLKIVLKDRILSYSLSPLCSKLYITFLLYLNNTIYKCIRNLNALPKTF